MCYKDYSIFALRFTDRKGNVRTMLPEINEGNELPGRRRRNSGSQQHFGAGNTK